MKSSQIKVLELYFPSFLKVFFAVMKILKEYQAFKKKKNFFKVTYLNFLAKE